MARTMGISAEDHARISAAVASAEAKSDGEISTMAARQSDSYAEWAVLLAALVAFIVPALVAIDSRGFNDLLIEITGAWHVDYSFGVLAAATVALQLKVFLLIWLALLWMPLRLALTPSVLKRQRVHEAAIKAFRIGIESRTRAATGVLIYLSLAEQRAEIVGDAAIDAKVSSEDWLETMTVLIGEVKAQRPGDGIVQAVELTGTLLAQHFPRSHDDQNEMPDRLIEL